ncbi:hypothetical protein AA12467_0232 [Gluconobacter sphaericus NBRC 12467]|nr:hypothetical protein AA12467_0232 [Gluconobacter sphaericus NBRC 12467]
MVKRDVSNVVSANASQGLPTRKRKKPNVVDIIIVLGVNFEKLRNFDEFTESIIKLNKNRLIVTIKYSDTYCYFI